MLFSIDFHLYYLLILARFSLYIMKVLIIVVYISYLNLVTDNLKFMYTFSIPRDIWIQYRSKFYGHHYFFSSTHWSFFNFLLDLHLFISYIIVLRKLFNKLIKLYTYIFLFSEEVAKMCKF